MKMFKYICKRLIWLIGVFFVILTICFVLVKLLPITEAAQFGKDMNLILQRRERLGYNKPILVQYFIFLQRSVFGMDWGISEALYRGQEVWDVFVSKLPFSMIINVYSSLFSVPIGMFLGIYAALKKNRWQDHLISTSVMIFISVPSFVYALLVQYFLCCRWKRVPIYLHGRCSDLWFLRYFP